MHAIENNEPAFAALGLPASLLEALAQVGYETPSPIQSATIPPLLEGRDVIGMAQTGTGKTAAFALPILARLNPEVRGVQALVLCPTRELSMQVAEAFRTYASKMRGVRVLSIYGGQDMRMQLRSLKDGAHIVVATPGRLLDHMQRRSISFDEMQTVVLDEADEMLRMGFIEDVDTILAATPTDKNVALFSATMPARIREIAERHLNEPQEIRIKAATATNENIEQKYWLVSGTNKLDALTRLLEIEEYDGMIVFVRTRNSTIDLAEQLCARGFSAAALNGDMSQQARTRTVDELKKGRIDILIATDVAARGLDVERISHVMNYDIPYDEEAYVHRIGRTGRAGRTGKAILFVAPREQRMLRDIERVTRQRIEEIQLPTRRQLTEKRTRLFREHVAAALQREDAAFFHGIVDQICAEHECSAQDVAAALAFLLQEDRPLQPPAEKEFSRSERPTSDRQDSRGKERSARGERDSSPRPRRDSGPIDTTPSPLRDFPEIDMERYRLNVGRMHGVLPKEIVGAIANEADIEGRYIGSINIFEDFSTVDLPDGMPAEIFQHLRKTRVRGRPLEISRMNGPAPVADTSEEAPASKRAPANAASTKRPASAKKPAAKKAPSKKAPRPTNDGSAPPKRKPPAKAAKSPKGDHKKVRRD